MFWLNPKHNVLMFLKNRVSSFIGARSHPFLQEYIESFVGRFPESVARIVMMIMNRLVIILSSAQHFCLHVLILFPHHRPRNNRCRYLPAGITRCYHRRHHYYSHLVVHDGIGVVVIAADDDIGEACGDDDEDP